MAIQSHFVERDQFRLQARLTRGELVKYWRSNHESRRH